MPALALRGPTVLPWACISGAIPQPSGPHGPSRSNRFAQGMHFRRGFAGFWASWPFAVQPFWGNLEKTLRSDMWGEVG